MILKILKGITAWILLQFYKVNQPEKNDILSIYFHNPSKELFDRLLKWLFSNGYKIISVKELDYLIRNKLKTEKSAIITFDDGWNKNLDLIDSIKVYNIPVTIFIPTEAVISGNYWFEYARIMGQQKYTGIKKIKDFKNLPETVLTERIEILKEQYSLNRSCITLNELKKLHSNDLVTIGSHTVTHPILNNCSDEKQKDELITSKQTLTDWLNDEIDYIAYPNGNFDQTTIDIAKRSGYKLGFSTIPGRIDVENVNPYLIPRNCIDDNGEYLESIAKILGIWQKYIKI